MPDTGSPWNIPYAEPSSLVRDWPALSEDVAEAVAAGLSEVNVIRQVVSHVKNDPFTVSGITAYTDVTGFEVTITPTRDTSKVLVVATFSSEFATGGSGAPNTGVYSIFRGATQLADPTSPGTRQVGLSFVTVAQVQCISILDSPATDAATTYKVRVATGSTSHTNSVGARTSDADSSANARTPSMIYAIEVAG